MFEVELKNLERTVTNQVSIAGSNPGSGTELKARVKVQALRDQTLRVKILQFQFFTGGRATSLVNAHEILGANEVGFHVTYHGSQEFKRFLEEPMIVSGKQGKMKNIIVSKDEPECVTKIKKSLLVKVQNGDSSPELKLLKEDAILIPIPIPTNAKRIKV